MENIKIIGTIHSPLKNIGDCPLQEREAAPQATISIDNNYLPAISGLGAGSRVFLFTWLHLADRNVLKTKPRNDPKSKTLGVFATRSPDRPNPIGLHEVEILEITGANEIRVSNLEVLDGTPLIDIKPVL